MGNFMINAVGILIVIWIAFYIYLKLHPRAFDKQIEKKFERFRESFRKSDEERLGRRMQIPREGAEAAEVNLYLPELKQKRNPVVFMLHGGQFVDGDADQIDSFCDRMKDLWDAVIISINYAKLDAHKIPYQQEEIRDVVLYFGIHAEEYDIDIHRSVLMGFSAGAYYCVGAASLLEEKGLKTSGIVMCSPFIDDTLIRFCQAGIHPEPVMIITAEKESMQERLDTYKEYLEKAGTDAEFKVYEGVTEGFLEHNNPEFENNSLYKNDPSVSEEQKEIARACEIYLGQVFEKFFEKQENV